MQEAINVDVGGVGSKQWTTIKWSDTSAAKSVRSVTWTPTIARRRGGASVHRIRSLNSCCHRMFRRLRLGIRRPQRPLWNMSSVINRKNNSSSAFHLWWIGNLKDCRSNELRECRRRQPGLRHQHNRAKLYRIKKLKSRIFRRINL